MHSSRHTVEEAHQNVITIYPIYIKTSESTHISTTASVTGSINTKPTQIKGWNNSIITPKPSLKKAPA